MIAALVLAWLAQGERVRDAELERTLSQDVLAWTRTEPPEAETIAAVQREAEGLEAPGLVRLLGNLGHHLGQVGRSEEARALVRWSGEQALALGELATRSWALEWLGQEAWVRAELEEALALLGAAAECDATRAAALDEVRHRSDVARLCMTLGRHRQALLEIQRAAQTAAGSGSSAAARGVAEVQASLLYDLGRHREALELCVAQAPLESSAVPHDEFQVRLDLQAATILADVGRLDTAVGYARRAHEFALEPAIARVAPLLHLEAKLTLGLLLGDLGHFDEGLARLDEAAREFERLGDPRGAAWAEKNRGFVCLAAGRFELAAGALERAWTAGATLGVPFLEALGALGTAEALVERQPEDARIGAGLLVAERLGEELHDRQILWRAAALRGRLAFERREFEPALVFLREALAGIESWRRELAAGGLVEHALRARADVYRLAASAAAEAGKLEEAFAIAGLLQARLADELGARRSGPLDAPDPELERLRQQLGELELTREPQQAAALEATRAELDRRLLSDDLAHGRVLTGDARSIPLDELRRGLVAERLDLALVYLVGPRTTLVLRLDADPNRAPEARTLALGRAELERLVARLRAPVERLEAGEVDLVHLDFDLEAARNLYALLVAPLELAPGARLALLLDGDLAALPFEQLVCGGALARFDPARPGAHLAGLEFLGDEHALVRVSSLARLARPRPARTGETVLVSPPDALGIAHARDERAELVRVLGAARLLADASVDDLVRVLGSAGRVHVAAHARLDPARPAHGSLWLGGAQSSGAPFEAWRAAELDLAGLEIVLAACHTGRGEWHEGAGLAGLLGGFLTGGAREVVASQWAVDDLSSARFLALYHGARARGVDAPGALLEARRALRAEYPHPFHRAAWFVQR